MFDFAQMAEQFFRIVETAPVGYALLAIFLWVLIEEAGIPLAPTADMVLLFAGWQVALGRLHPVAVIGLTVLATVLGSLLLYWLSLRGGRPFALTHGKILRIDESKLDRGEAFLNRYRGPSLMIGRFIPGLKTVTSIVSGLFQIPVVPFIAYTAFSATIWATSSVTLGAVFGPHVGDIASVAMEHPRVAWSIAAMITMVGAVVILRRRRRTT